ncbi:hypothetical protein D1K37_20705 [Salmonella enterica]|nr:hypothetical protein [Salmonella enterica]
MNTIALSMFLNKLSEFFLMLLYISCKYFLSVFSMSGFSFACKYIQEVIFQSGANISLLILKLAGLRINDVRNHMIY